MMKRTALATALYLTLSLAAAAQNQTPAILQYAKDGNRVGLESLKRAAAEKSLALPLSAEEALMVNALLETNGSVAAKLYQDLIRQNPSSPFVPVADARLKEYNAALAGSAPSAATAAPPPSTPPTPPPPTPPPVAVTKPADPPPAPIVKSAPDDTPPPLGEVPSTSSNTIKPATKPVGKNFAIQFASFSESSQAETLQKSLRAKVQTRIVKITDAIGKVLYKVRSEEFFASREAATAAAKKLQIDYFVVQE
jgi:cell division septation protein DedD